MRRVTRPSPPVPESLCRFVAAEWPGGDSLGQWKAARRSWLEEHGVETLLGDLLDVVRAEVRVKRRLATQEDDEAGRTTP